MLKQYFENLAFKRLLKKIDIHKLDTLKGVEFESFVAKLFNYLGYKSTLTRSTGDNGIDVIAKRHGKSLAIQTKLYYNHSVGNKAIQEVFSGKNFYKLDYAILITNWTLSKPAWSVARELKVAVIDRNILTIILRNSQKQSKKIIKNILKGLE